jgi:hypothetical protein
MIMHFVTVQHTVHLSLSTGGTSLYGVLGCTYTSTIEWYYRQLSPSRCQVDDVFLTHHDARAKEVEGRPAKTGRIAQYMLAL